MNDEAVAGWTVEQVVAKIRGEVGTKVKLLLKRGNEPVELSITRAEVSSPTVEAEIVGDTGVLTVSRFNGETATLARTGVEKFLQAV